MSLHYHVNGRSVYVPFRILDPSPGRIMASTWLMSEWILAACMLLLNQDGWLESQQRESSDRSQRPIEILSNQTQSRPPVSVEETVKQKSATSVSLPQGPCLKLPHSAAELWPPPVITSPYALIFLACFEGFVDCLCLIRCDIAIHKDVPASDSLCLILPIYDPCNYVHHVNY